MIVDREKTAKMLICDQLKIFILDLIHLGLFVVVLFEEVENRGLKFVVSSRKFPILDFPPCRRRIFRLEILHVALWKTSWEVFRCLTLIKFQR